MQRVIMFNGPPHAGKDTAGEFCREFFGENATHAKFTQPVKDRAHSQLGLKVATDHFEALKDVKLDEFEGMTPREYYIRTSERLRQRYGHDVVAKLLVQSLTRAETPFIVNTDLGNDTEANTLMNAYGAENCLLIRIHREGKNFDNDCRTWVRGVNVASFDIPNRTMSQFRGDLEDVLDRFGFRPELTETAPETGMMTVA